VPLPRTRGRKAGEGRAPNFLHVYQSPSCRLPTSSRVPRVLGGRLETHIREARNDSLFNRSVHACLTMKWSFMMRQHPRPFFLSLYSLYCHHVNLIYFATTRYWLNGVVFLLKRVPTSSWCSLSSSALRHAGDVLQSTYRPTVRQRRKG
jgi:hypothetical protein